MIVHFALQCAFPKFRNFQGKSNNFALDFNLPGRNERDIFLLLTEVLTCPRLYTIKGLGEVN